MSDVERLPVIRAIVADALGTFAMDLDTEADLFGLGLDSLGGVQVLAGIEDEFGIVIPDDLLSIESLRTLRALDELVCAVLA